MTYLIYIKMKNIILALVLFCVHNFYGQTNTSLGNSNIKKTTTRVDMNRLSLESKIVGKTALPMLYSFKNERLILNGAGLRELLWVDVYACGLYLNHPETNAKNIINKDETMIVRMDILSKAVSHNKMIKAFHKGIIDGNSPAVVNKLKSEIELFLEYIEGLTLKVGDKVDVVYEPNKGLSLYINYNKIGTVGGIEFKKAILNIWLSNNPVDKSLKPELLDGAKKYMLN